FWSPDNRFLGFFADTHLKKIEVAGGPPQVLCDITIGRGGTWSREGVIVFAGNRGVLHRVAASGGEPVQVTTHDPAKNETAHYWPWFLPDGRHFVFLTRTQTGSVLYAASSDTRETGRTQILSG